MKKKYRTDFDFHFFLNESFDIRKVPIQKQEMFVQHICPPKDSLFDILHWTE